MKLDNHQPLKNCLPAIILLLLLMGCQQPESYELTHDVPDTPLQLSHPCNYKYPYNCDEITPPADPSWDVPVVVHVINTGSETSISDDEICRQIQTLNEGFRLTHSQVGEIVPVYQPIATDTRINFTLDYIVRVCPTDAQIPSNGAFPFPNSSNCIIVDLSPKSDANTPGVNREDYLHIWVADYESDCIAGSIAKGYNVGLIGDVCQTAIDCSDGVYIDYQAFGAPEDGHLCARYHLGRVLIHETGHWLGLKHPIDDEGGFPSTDCVNDTTCPSPPLFTCADGLTNMCNNVNPPQVEMFQNFMVGNPDGCSLFFTQGQQIRMVDHLCTFRSQFSVVQPPTCFN